jgi:hypothetical protein
LAVACGVLLGGGPARAEEPPTVTVTPGEPAGPGGPAAAPTTAPNLLAAADAAVDAGNLELARALYERVVTEFAGTPEGRDARRALKIIAARVRSGALGAPVPQSGGDDSSRSDGVIVRREPYSLKTLERLRLTAWEKLDFGISAFLYGASVGFSYSLSLDNQTSGNIFPPVAIGALAYTLGAVAFLNLADPDRGDLPLALAITSYVPTTTLLVANAAITNPNGKKTALATALAGLASVPIAVVAANKLDLDPGDTQLVRDSGFWGLVLATTGTLGFGGSTQEIVPGFSAYRAPSGRTVATAGLIGLYGGMGLGLLSAHFSDVTLERVRVTTWGGYGGAVLGLLLAAGAGHGDADAYKGVSVGALMGLVVTFIATSGLDGIPADDPGVGPPPAHARGPRFAPTMMQLAGIDGQLHPALGFTGLTF